MSSAIFAQAFSPLARLQATLAAQVSSGAVRATDQSALSSAITEIDTAMQSGPVAASSPPPSREAMKSKLSGLIAGEVSDGTLTAEQASELNNVFAQAFAGALQGGQGPQGGGGPRGGGGGGGAEQTSSDPADTNGDGVVTAAEQAAYDAKSATGAAPSKSSSNDSDKSKLLSDFLKLLQDSKGSSPGYGSGGSVRAQSDALVVDYSA